MPSKRYALRLILAMLLLVYVYVPASAATFVPDRAYFFDRCGLMTNFKMSGAFDAIPDGRGKTGLSEGAKEAINGIFDVWERERGSDPKQIAFILATARRESAGTWKPIREVPGCGSDEKCREDDIASRLKKGSVNYAKPAANGQRYYGRGYIQLTFESNYARTSRFLGVGMELRDQPDKVMELEVAETILVRGMLEGWYGEKKPLSFYLPDGAYVPFNGWLAARNNVNPGSPHKPIVARSAIEILGCLRPVGA